MSRQPSATACFSFDNMGEAADIGAGRLDGPRPSGADPSLAVGYPKLFDLLERRRIRASFFVEGWNGENHPEAVREIVRRGHELGMHGWLHEPWAELEPAREVVLARRATEALERAAGARPVGFRAPGGARSAATEEILLDLGYAYDASLGEGSSPGRLSAGLAQVPFVWAGVDGAYYLRPDPPEPAEVRDLWLAALRKTADEGGLFLLIGHAFLTGVEDARLDALDAVMEAASRDTRIEVHTVGEVASALPVPATSPPTHTAHP
ncbi:MAG: polysaccharide deacetylase family protein [Proteobacteria bacterium]|nr:polysaccharide deacetylase family protein [Pseudomonadota bacterium]